jgi:hypothetical protein
MNDNQGMSAEEVARAMGWSEATQRRLERRLFVKLARMLRARGLDREDIPDLVRAFRDQV